MIQDTFYDYLDVLRYVSQTCVGERIAEVIKDAIDQAASFFPSHAVSDSFRPTGTLDGQHHCNC